MERAEPAGNASGEGARVRQRSRSSVHVPRYSLYGDLTSRREWFVNVEPLDQRASAVDWRIEPHTHPHFTQLVFVSEGSGEMTLDGDLLAFRCPCVLVVPPFRIHGFRYGEPSRGTVLTVENNYLGDLLARAPDLRPVLETAGVFPLSGEAAGEVATHVAQLSDELSQVRTGGVIAAEIRLLQVMLTMLRDRPSVARSAQTGRALLVDRFLEIVETRYREQPDIDSISDTLSVTPSQLRSACRAATGLSPLAILHDRIAAEAKRCLVYSSMPISEIGYSLGFADAAYFTRFFKRVQGVSPSRFRQS